MSLAICFAARRVPRTSGRLRGFSPVFVVSKIQRVSSRLFSCIFAPEENGGRRSIGHRCWRIHDLLATGMEKEKETSHCVDPVVESN